MTFPWVDDEVIDRMCEGLTQPAAKIRQLERLGLTVKQAPSGRPLVLQENFDVVFGVKAPPSPATDAVARPGAQPDRGALVLQFARRGA